jgi:rubrerythrin
MSLQRLLKTLIDAENRLGELYAWYAEVYADDAEAASLFYRMSRDEKAHAALIEYEKRLVNKEKDAVLEISLTEQEAAEFLRRVETVLSSRQAPPLKEALSIALALEESGAENHLAGVSSRVAPGLVKLLQNLGKEDRRHYSDLAALARRRGLPVPPAGKGAP